MKSAPVLVLSAAFLLNSPDLAGSAEKRPYGPAPYTGPMIDAHNHPKKPNRDKLAAHFADASSVGIERVVVMRTPNDYRKPSRDRLLRRAAPWVAAS